MDTHTSQLACLVLFQTKEQADDTGKKSVSSGSSSQPKGVTKDDQIYDFDQSNEDGLKLVLFPEEENEENNIKGVKKYTGNNRKRKATGKIEKEKKAKMPKRTLKSRDRNIKLMLDKLIDEKKAETTENGIVKINTQKKGNQWNTGSQTSDQKRTRKAEQSKFHSRSANSEPTDSGVFGTPVLRSSNRKRKVDSDATSTPSLLPSDTKKTKSTPKDYQPPVMPSPMLSPVLKMSPIDFSPKKHKNLDRVVEASSPNFKSPRPGRL